VQDLVIRLGLLTNYPPYMDMNTHIISWHHNRYSKSSRRNKLWR
jgi:hypothetical protein